MNSSFTIHLTNKRLLIFFHQIKQRFRSGLGKRNHFGFITRAFGFDNYAHFILVGFSEVDHQVFGIFGIYFVSLPVKGIAQEIAYMVFLILFPLNFINFIQQSNEVRFKQFDLTPQWFLIQESFIKGFARIEGLNIH